MKTKRRGETQCHLGVSGELILAHRNKIKCAQFATLPERSNCCADAHGVNNFPCVPIACFGLKKTRKRACASCAQYRSAIPADGRGRMFRRCNTFIQRGGKTCRPTSVLLASTTKRWLRRTPAAAFRKDITDLLMLCGLMLAHEQTLKKHLK